MLWLFFTFLIGAVQSQDCTYSLSGTVTDEHDSSSLDGATIYLIGQEKGVYADIDGRFALDGLCLGLDSLRVTHIGCEPVKVYVTIREKNPQIQVFLEHHAELLDGIEVHAHRNQTSSSDIGATLSGEQLDRTAGENFATVVQQLPGVRQIGTGANVGRPLVDGLGGSRLQIVQGGIALASQDWGDEHALEIDPFAVANVQLARSGGTVKYGTSTTGASLVLDDAQMPTSESMTGKGLLHGASNTEAFGGGVHLEQRLSPSIGFRVQAAGSAQGDARAPDYVLSNTGARKGSGMAQVFYTDTMLQLDASYRGFGQGTGILRAAHIGNLTDLERALDSDRPLTINPWTRNIDAPRQAVAHHWFAANARYALENDAALRMSYSYQYNVRQEYDIRRGGRSAIPSLDMTLSTTDIRLAYQQPAWKQWHGELGISGRTSENRNDQGTGTAPFIPFYDASSFGLYADERYIGDKTTWELSGRTDVRSTSAVWFVKDETGESVRYRWSKTNWTGALAVGMAHYTEDGSSLRARLAYSSRVPNPAERFADGVHHALAVIELGDTSLTVEHGLKAVLGYGLERENGLELHASVFAQGFRGFIYQQNLPDPVLTIRGAFPVVAYEQSDAFLAGFDLDVHFPIGPLQLAAEASYLYGQLPGGLALPDVAPLQLGSTLSYSQTTNGRLKDWRIAASLQHLGEQGRAPEVLPARPPGAYTLAGFEASSHMVLGENVMGVHLRVLNLFNTEYRDYLDRLRYYAARPGRDIQLRFLYDF
ncbi:MAG: carboxypeptidase-like regulatory domain-containing protein [Saprospiraceae bacterium]